MKTTSFIVGAYGLLILIGGIMGHVKAASTASLIMGVIFGILILFSSFGIYRGKLIGQYAALILAFFLDAFFSYRFLQSMKFMPAGLLSLISLAVLIFIAWRLPKKR